MQVVALTQKVDSLQAQLTGAQKRASQLTAEIQSLQQTLAERDAEIKRLKTELEKANACVTALGKELRELRLSQVQPTTKTQHHEAIDSSLRTELETAKKTIQSEQQKVKMLSEAALQVINNQEGALEQLRSILMEVGDPKYRVLGLVLKRRRLKVDEIASTIVADVAATKAILEELQSAGEVEIQDGNTVILGKKYREVELPIERWKSATPVQVLDDLERLVTQTEDDNETVARLIETAVDILEQKIPRGGALVFQMRKTAGRWKTKREDIEELRYTIRDWKSRV